MKEEVSQKANDREKRDTWVEKMKEMEGKESMKNQALIYSRQSIFRWIKYLV